MDLGRIASRSPTPNQNDVISRWIRTVFQVPSLSPPPRLPPAEVREAAVAVAAEVTEEEEEGDDEEDEAAAAEVAVEDGKSRVIPLAVPIG